MACISEQIKIWHSYGSSLGWDTTNSNLFFGNHLLVLGPVLLCLCKTWYCKEMSLDCWCHLAGSHTLLLAFITFNGMKPVMWCVREPTWWIGGTTNRVLADCRWKLQVRQGKFAHCTYAHFIYVCSSICSMCCSVAARQLILWCLCHIIVKCEMQ